jgi:hypothetical protein
MAETRLNFTKAAIDALPSAGKGKRAYYYDQGKAPVLAVTDRGTKTFLIYRSVNSPPERNYARALRDRRRRGLTIEQGRKAAADDTTCRPAGAENASWKILLLPKRFSNASATRPA